MGDEIPGLTQYMKICSPSAVSNLQRTTNTETDSVCIGSFPNPPEIDVKSTPLRDKDTSHILEEYPVNNEVPNHVSRVKYLLFAGHKKANKECLELAFRVAKDVMGIPAIISADQMTEGSDELSMLAYLSEFFWISDLSQNAPFDKLIDTGDFAGYIDRLMSSYVNESSNLLDIFLTLSTNHYYFVSMIKGDADPSSTTPLHYNKEWFYPIITCTNDSNCSVEKLKYVSKKVVKLTDKKVSEQLSQSCPIEEKSLQRKKNRNGFITYAGVPQGSKENLLFDALSKISYLRLAYKDIFNLVNSVSGSETEKSQSRSNNENVIASKDLSNLTFLHDQINRQLEEFLFGAFSDVKKAIDNYISLVSVAKTELDSLEEELRGTNNRAGGMIFEAIRIVSEIKELDSLKSLSDKDSTSSASVRNIQAERVPRVKQSLATTVKVDTAGFSKSGASYSGITLVNDRSQSGLDKNGQDSADGISEGNKTDTKVEIQGILHSMSSQNTLVNHVTTGPTPYLCEKCSRWAESPENSLLLIYFVSKHVFNRVFEQINPSTSRMGYTSNFGKELSKINYDEVPRCCINIILNETSHYRTPQMKKKSLVSSENRIEYFANMYSSSTINHKLTALVLTSQNMITRAEHITDILKARFGSFQGINFGKGECIYSSKQTTSLSVAFPASIKEQVRRLIKTAEVEIVQYLKNNVISYDLSNVRNQNDISPTKKDNLDVSKCINQPNDTSLLDIKNKGSLPFWRNVSMSIENYYKRYILLECQLKMYYTDLETLKVQNYLSGLGRKSGRAIPFQELKDAKKIAEDGDLNIYSTRELVLKLASLWAKVDNSNISTNIIDGEIEALDNIWGEIISSVVSSPEAIKKKFPHESIKTLFYSAVTPSKKQQSAFLSKGSYHFDDTAGSCESPRANRVRYNDNQIDAPPDPDTDLSVSKFGSATLADNSTYSNQIAENQHAGSELFGPAGIEQELSGASENTLPDESSMDTISSCTKEEVRGVSNMIPTDVRQVVRDTGTSPNYYTNMEKNRESHLHRSPDVITEDQVPIKLLPPSEGCIHLESRDGDNLADSIYYLLNQGAEPVEEVMEKILDSNELPSISEYYTDGEMLSNIHQEAVCRLDGIMDAERKFLDIYEINIDEICLLNTNLCSFLEELKGFSEKLVLDLTSLYNVPLESTPGSGLVRGLPESTNLTPLFNVLSSIQITSPLSTTYLIISTFYHNYKEVKDIFSRIEPLFTYTRKVVDFMRCITEYVSVCKKHEEVATEQFKMLENSIIHNTDNFVPIRFELKYEMMNSAQNYLQAISERIEIKARNIDSLQNALFFDQHDKDVIDRIKRFAVNETKKLFESEYRGKIEKLISQISGARLAVCELSLFYGVLNSLIDVLKSDICIESSIVPPSNILSPEFELLISGPRYNQEIDIQALDKLLQLPLIEKVDMEIITESAKRQAKRSMHYEKLESIAHKVSSITDKFNNGVFKFIGSIVEDSINAVSSKLKILNNLSSEIREIIEQHISCIKDIRKARDDIVNEIKDVVLKLSDTAERIRRDTFDYRSQGSMDIFKELVQKVNRTLSVAEIIKDGIVTSELSSVHIDALVNSTQGLAKSYAIIDSKRTLDMAKGVREMIASIVDGTYQDIMACAHHVITRYLLDSEYIISQFVQGDFAEMFKEVQLELYSLDNSNLNAEAYISLCRVRSKSLILRIARLNGELFVIEEGMAPLHAAYETWKSLFIYVPTIRCNEDFNSVGRRYKDIITSYAIISVEFADLYRVVSLSVSITNLSRYTRNCLSASHTSGQLSGSVNREIIQQLVEARIKFFDYVASLLSCLSNMALNCNDLHAFVYVSSLWIYDRLGDPNLKITAAVVSERDIKQVMMKSDFDACESDARKIKVLTSHVTSLVVAERNYVIDLCSVILRDGICNRNRSSACEVQGTEEKSLDNIIEAIRLMGTILYNVMKDLSRAKKKLYGTVKAIEERNGFVFSAYKHVLRGNEEGSVDFGVSKILDLAEDLETSFSHLSQAIDYTGEDIIELIGHLFWAENVLDMCVPGMRALVLQIKSYSCSEDTIETVLSERIRLFGYWAGMIGAWNSQVSQILNANTHPLPLQVSDRIDFEGTVIAKRGLTLGEADARNTLLGVESQSSFIVKQELVQTLKDIIRSNLLLELQHLRDIYNSAVELSRTETGV